MSEADVTGSFKNWCATLNNYVEDDIDAFRVFIGERCSYGVFQRETGESGTPHLQAYFCLNIKSKLVTLKKQVGNRWRLSVRGGTHEQAAKYCKKEDTRDAGTMWEEFGEAAGHDQGARSDVTAFYADIKGGMATRELLDKHPRLGIASLHKLPTLRALHAPKPVYERPKVIVHWGESGTGKSALAYDLADGNLYEHISGNGKWFEGYDGQPWALFDDYRGEIPYGMLLRLLDGYGCNVEFKGGSARFNSKCILITSNDHPDQWYTYNTKNPWAALQRRISECWEFKFDGHGGVQKVLTFRNGVTARPAITVIENGQIIL